MNKNHSEILSKTNNMLEKYDKSYETLIEYTNKKIEEQNNKNNELVKNINNAVNLKMEEQDRKNRDFSNSMETRMNDMLKKYDRNYETLIDYTNKKIEENSIKNSNYITTLNNAKNIINEFNSDKEKLKEYTDRQIEKQEQKNKEFRDDMARQYDNMFKTTDAMLIRQKEAELSSKNKANNFAIIMGSLAAVVIVVVIALQIL